MEGVIWGGKLTPVGWKGRRRVGSMRGGGRGESRWRHRGWAPLFSHLFHPYPCALKRKHWKKKQQHKAFWIGLKWWTRLHLLLLFQNLSKKDDRQRWVRDDGPTWEADKKPSKKVERLFFVLFFVFFFVVFFGHNLWAVRAISMCPRRMVRFCCLHRKCFVLVVGGFGYIVCFDVMTS